MHEHHLGCGHIPNAELHEHQVHVHLIENLGHLCRSGHCHHPEHQFMLAELEQQQYEGAQTIQTETSTSMNSKSKDKRKKVKQKAMPWFGALLVRAT